MQTMAGQGEQKVAAPGFHPLLLRVLGQKAKHAAADARVTGVASGNEASHDGRHLPIAPLTTPVEGGEKGDRVELNQGRGSQGDSGRQRFMADIEEQRESN